MSNAFIDLWKSRDLVQLRDLQDEEPWRVMDGRLFNSPVRGELPPVWDQSQLNWPWQLGVGELGKSA